MFEEVPLLSIIIPCFNSFHLMTNGLRSVSKLENVEVIVVDDCSTDDSYEQILEYSKSYPMVKVYRNDRNSGPGLSRNYGISQSTGKYITFLDSDDYFTDDFLLSVLPVLNKNPECVIFDGSIVYQSHKTYFPMLDKSFAEGYIDNKDALVFVKGCTWGKIYRSELLKKHQIEFLRLKRNEDMPFTKCAIAFATDIYYLPRPFYNYIDNKESLMHDSSLLDVTNAQNAFFFVRDRIGNLYPEEIEAIFAVEYLYSTVLTNIQKLKRREVLEYIDSSEKLYPDWNRNKYIQEFGRLRCLILYFIKHRNWIVLKSVIVLKRIIKKTN